METEIAETKNVEKAALMNDRIPSAAVGAQEASIKAARMAGHQVKMARKCYILESGNPEQDAYTSKAYIEVFKGPLPPLTPAQEEAQKSRTAADILEDFARLTAKKEAQAGNDEDDGGEKNVESQDEQNYDEDKDDDDEDDAASDVGVHMPADEDEPGVGEWVVGWVGGR